MKKILLLAMVFVLPFVSYSQYYYLPSINAGQNPGGINNDAEYPVGGGIPAGWTTILGGPQTTPAWSPSQNLAFPFVFNGDTVDSYFVSSSGVLTFSMNPGTVPPHANLALPNSAIPDSSVCIWGLASSGATDNIVTKTFGTSPNRQHWVTFSSYSFGGGIATDWVYWSIVLEETSNNIYVVDQRTNVANVSLTIGVQINSTTAAQVIGSPNVVSHASTDPTPADNSYYTFIKGTQNAYDCAVTGTALQPYLILASAPFTVSGRVFNYGSATVQSLVLNYSVDGGATVTTSFANLNISMFSDSLLSVATPWSPTQSGAYNLKIWASSINGNADLDNSNDTLNLIVSVISQTVQRLPLLEAFTSSTCGPCVAGNNNLKTVLGANPNKWALIKYQMSWPGAGDPYYTLEGGERRTLYGISGVPALVVDAAPSVNTTNYTAAMLNTAYNKAAFVGLVASFGQAGAGKTLDINVTINPHATMPGNNLRLHTAIFEYKTTQNTGSNGETSFDYVMKKMVPDAGGTTITALSDGVAQTKALSYTFNGNFRKPANSSSPINHAIEHSVEEFFDLGVIVWLQDNVTKEVFQAAYATKTSGIGQVNDGNGIVGLFPNPANETAFLKYQLMSANEVSIAVYDLSGRQILSHNYGKQEQGVYDVNIPTEELSSGLYMVKLQIGNRHFTDKLNIRK